MKLQEKNKKKKTFSLADFNHSVLQDEPKENQSFFDDASSSAFSFLSLTASSSEVFITNLKITVA